MTKEQQETSGKVGQDDDDKDEKKERRPTGGMRKKAFDKLKEDHGAGAAWFLARSADRDRFGPQVLNGTFCLLASRMPGRKLVKGGYLLEVLSMLQ